MSLKVIGSGFGRTGTMSMKHALELLGFEKCHHMGELYENSWQVPHWLAAAKGDAVDWKMLLQGYRACVDWPSAHYWRDLVAAFPEAVVIHTTRPAEAWWQSYSETIMKFVETGISLPAGPVRDMCQWCADVIGEQTFGSDYRDRDAGIRAFNRRLMEVRDAIPADRLLVFEVAEGWSPLCSFVGVQSPDMPFPRVNDRTSFWENFATDL